ncbi:MAG: sugar-transfer associated ATP-grasp domain-containing protein [Eubacteriales bacterium]|nr:sugar-transfer associated ATP-grasp domain-containing protein [Eubacteriales bacterium]MDD4540944.1 sugar-transfer associated ATP-grasp domain-containing protein [Eubacteriales bacterium]
MSVFSKISKIFTADWSTLFQSTRQLRKDSGRGFVDLILDQARMFRRGGYTWAEYSLYEFDRITDPALRATFGSEYYDNKLLIRSSSTAESQQLFGNKAAFNRRFSKYLNRDHMNLEEDSELDFKEFVSRHPVFFAKIPRGHGGVGVSKIKTDAETDLNQLYRTLVAQGQTVLEEEIHLHEDLLPISPAALCTLRIGTVLQKDGSVEVLYSRLRTSMSDPVVDNVSRGGGYTMISDEGVLLNPCISFKPYRRYVERHPITGTEFVGFKIPDFDRVLDYARELAHVVPEQAYAGWDITVTADGPVVIEGNEIPALYMYQAAQFFPDDVGPRANLERVFGISLPAPKL